MNDKELQRLILCELEKNGNAIKYIPADIITEEMCYTALRSVRWNEADILLPHIPPKFFSKDFCLEAVEKFVSALKYIPETKLDFEICFSAIKKYPQAFIFVPQKFQTDEIRKYAVENMGGILEYIPEAERTEELCQAAFGQDKSAICYIPERYVTEKMCIEAAMMNEETEFEKVHLRDIPQKLRTAEVCLRVIKDHNREVTDDVPKKLREEVGQRLTEYWREKDEKRQREWDQLQDICRHPHHLKELSPRQRRRELLCSVAVEQDGMLLRFVPKDMRDINMCVKAVISDVDSLMYVPDEIKPAVIDSVKSSGCLLKIIFSESDCRKLFI